ncbi:glycosyltransferase family 4 protein [Ramlibacter rhizophilus]|uniref:Glycosyl transferase n=1 Tax=Ramlibacter rhizophilus TaxID=1781167 RepID=A0A4Z0BN66_9BURK|nr:glycosyltransferase [Ramlibacter rhizophilus]TFY99687.1 glycosyl transferase [Ramlibacter rhizophilus]
MLLLLIVTAVVSALACALLLRHGQHLAARYGLDMPQRFHLGHTPRLGGAAMMLACSAGWLWMTGSGLPLAHDILLSPALASSWLMVALLGAGGGLAEDVTHRLKARWRLGCTLAAGLAAVFMLDVRIDSLGVDWLDQAIALLPWAPMVLAIVAVAGLPHAFNLIDGYNGLASTVAIVCCLALAYVAFLVGDRQLMVVVLSLAGATAGFLVWNYPRGLIFAGDGGAYLWGVVIAVASIQLAQRHAEVSPWFPMLLLIYPVWETLFSSYRKLARGQSPGLADALHFHQLIYRRIVRGVFSESDANRVLQRNNRTSPYLWGFTLLTVIPAVLFWNNTPVLIGFCLLFVLSYLYAYLSIVRFKVPRWIRR